MKIIILLGVAAACTLTACGTVTSSPPATTAPVTAASPTLSSSSLYTLMDDIVFPGPAPEIHASEPVTEPFPSGRIDWTGNTVRATGTGVVDPSNPNTAQARLMAERAAVVIAQRNLLEIVEGVRVDSETRVENFMTDYDVVHTRVQGMVRNAVMAGPSRYDAEAGTVEVELSMEIYGPQGLSGALSAAFAAPQLSQEQVSPQVRDFLQQYSGLVIDGGQSGLTPSMFPRILDENGNLLLDTSQYAAYLGTGAGMGLRFISDLEGLLEQGDMAGSPLILRAVQAAGSLGSDIVLSTADAGGGILKQALPFLLGAGRFLLRVIL